MHTYRSLSFALIMLLMVQASSASAALVPKAADRESRFYTTADFSFTEFRKSMGKGFLAGLTYQSAAFIVAGKLLVPNYASMGLVAQ